MLPPKSSESSSRSCRSRCKHLQNFEPAGVGARDLGECLALQLQRAARSHAVSRPRRSTIVTQSPRCCSPRATSRA